MPKPKRESPFVGYARPMERVMYSIPIYDHGVSIEAVLKAIQGAQ